MFISLEKEIFNGNVLDITLNDNGIIYNVYKHTESEIDIDIVNGELSDKKLVKGVYDTCIAFFSLSFVGNSKLKNHIVDMVYEGLKPNGIFYIWDINKPRFSIVDETIKVGMPNDEIKSLSIKDYNFLSDRSRFMVEEYLKNRFEIIRNISTGKVYCLTCRKRGNWREKSFTSCN